jgi:hypothetical protein
VSRDLLHGPCLNALASPKIHSQSLVYTVHTPIVSWNVLYAGMLSYQLYLLLVIYFPCPHHPSTGRLHSFSARLCSNLDSTHLNDFQLQIVTFLLVITHRRRVDHMDDAPHILLSHLLRAILLIIRAITLPSNLKHPRTYLYPRDTLESVETHSENASLRTRIFFCALLSLFSFLSPC